MQLLAIFIAYPLAALLVAAAFVALYVAKRHMSSVVTAVIWALYSIYEYLMHARVLCTGECNIRVDLLLIYPGLIAISLIALVRSLRKARTSMPSNGEP